MSWDDAKPILRPQHVTLGVIKVDKELCTNCGLCIENCPFGCWERDDEDYPVMKADAVCFSCYNCQVACEFDAVSIVESYHVSDGFWATAPHPLPARMPIEPMDEDGNPTQFNDMERAIHERRSVRNFTDKPVPETLIRRVLEAGRFAPSAGNSQPWKFIVITDKEIIRQMDEAVQSSITMVYNMYKDDEQVKALAAGVDPNRPGGFDPRIAQGGFRAISNGELPASLGAPVIIILAMDDRAIGGPELQAGICGQNMNLVANTLGIKACWNGFIASAANASPLKEKLGIEPPFSVTTGFSIGYPKFKQEGMVPREFRPVTWFREGREGPEIDE